MVVENSKQQLYRPCVGMMLVNSENCVFVANRIDIKGIHWQMPQGGIEKHETPFEAALRELDEEIGTNKVELIAECSDWLTYDFPSHIAKRVWKGKFRGQIQKWFAFRFLGTDHDINLETDHPEFSDWRWIEINQLLTSVVPFKKDTYKEVIRVFQPQLIA